MSAAAAYVVFLGSKLIIVVAEEIVWTKADFINLIIFNLLRVGVRAGGHYLLALVPFFKEKRKK